MTGLGLTIAVPRGALLKETLDRLDALGLDTSEVRSYLEENLSFFLRKEEIAGLEEFYRRAHANGLILEPRPTEFWS